MFYSATAAIAAGGDVNLLEGRPIAYPPKPGYFHAGVNSSASGLRVNMTVNGENKASYALCFVGSALPAWPDEWILALNEWCDGGLLNQIEILNPTVGALTHSSAVRFTAQPHAA